ncbi:MAG: hypothetical protein IJV47_02080, partial [Candidatus Methanomethylophilaceae archaeon]|nr:hypothetical protein [Candidatus Methanomethylophilaceae archaeon]
AAHPAQPVYIVRSCIAPAHKAVKVLCVLRGGLILWIVWYDSKPKSSKMAGMGALIAVLLAVVIWVLLIVFAAVFASTQ